MPRPAYAACAVALKSAGNVVQLLPAGEFRAKDGRPHEVDAWVLAADSAATLIATSTGKGRFVIDYEHQSLKAGANGQPAPAAGWFKVMEWRDGEGLFATDVEWTDKAAQMIQSGEYRYLSPVLDYDRETGVITRLVSAALTNTPALDGMEEVAALSLTTDTRGSSEVREYTNTATAQIEALVRSSREALEALKQKTDEALKAQSEVSTLRQEIEAARIEATIEDALNGARLLPGQVEAARRLGKVDFEALSQLLDRPPLVPALLGMQTDRMRGDGKTPGKAVQTALSREEKHLCALTGRKPEEFAELKRRFAAEDSGLTD
ncbi:phage protease [Thauera sp.]|uniref:phage protease n=1 Tax=Thauera sp. TaxID=1905334 RepID=UPI002CF290EB|nr:phage protease [Thauera sp.]HRP26516.1 phage protease [Thauera sp.]